MSVDYSRGVVGRDPVGKSMVASFLAQFPDESDEEIHARMCKAWRGLSTEPLPITVDEIGHWRKEAAR